MDKKKASNILGAGTISGFILALFLLLNNGDVQGAVPSTTINAAAGITEVVPMENYNALQAQNDQLVQDLETMQSREQQYAEQIAAANDAVAQQNSNRNKNAAWPRYQCAANAIMALRTNAKCTSGPKLPHCPITSETRVSGTC